MFKSKTEKPQKEPSFPCIVSGKREWRYRTLLQSEIPEDAVMIREGNNWLYPLEWDKANEKYTPWMMYKPTKDGKDVTPDSLFQATRWPEAAVLLRIDRGFLEKLKVGMMIGLFAIAAFICFLIVSSVIE